MVHSCEIIEWDVRVLVVSGRRFDHINDQFKSLAYTILNHQVRSGLNTKLELSNEACNVNVASVLLTVLT